MHMRGFDFNPRAYVRHDTTPETFSKFTTISIHVPT